MRSEGSTVSGTTGHGSLSLPRASGAPRASGHVHQVRSRSTGLDWSQLYPACRSCGVRAGDVSSTSVLCPRCDPSRPKRPTAAPAEPVAQVRRPRVAKKGPAPREFDRILVARVTALYVDGGLSVAVVAERVEESIRVVKLILGAVGVEIRGPLQGLAQHDRPHLGRWCRVTNYRHPRIDPRVIRAALADADVLGVTEAARRHDVHHAAVHKWRRRRVDQPAWPTDADITAWDRSRARRDSYRRRRRLAGGPLLVDATGTVRRVRALFAIGHTSWDLAPAMGMSRAMVTDLVKGKHAQIARRTAIAAARAYDELSMTVPTDAPGPRRRGHVRVHDRQRRESAAKGWAPPLAWDEDTIDDPTAEPVGAAGPDGEPRCHRADPRLQAQPMNPDDVAEILAGDWTLPCSRATKVHVVAQWLQESRGTLRALEQLTGWNSARYAFDAYELLGSVDVESVA